MPVRIPRAEVELYEAAWLLQLSVNQARYLVWTAELEDVGQAGRVQVAVSELRRLLRGTDTERVLGRLVSGEISAPRTGRRSDPPVPLAGAGSVTASLPVSGTSARSHADPGADSGGWS